VKLHRIGARLLRQGCQQVGRRSGSAMMAMRLVMAVTIARTAPHKQNLSDRPENSPNASLKPAALPVSADKASSSAGRLLLAA
jgi:hypothetical protein